MKRLAAFLLVSLLLPYWAVALGLDELRAQAPAYVCFSVNGETWEAPVRLAKSASMPLYALKNLSFEPEQMRLDENVVCEISDTGICLNWNDGSGKTYSRLEDSAEPSAAAAAEHGFQAAVEMMHLPCSFAIHKAIPILSEKQEGCLLSCAVLLNGIPLYRGNWLGNYITFCYFSDDCWELRMSYMALPDNALAEADFLPFETVTQALQERIDAGTLLALDSIELWYGRCADGTAAPVWRVFGFDTEYHRGALPSAVQRFQRFPPNDYSFPLPAIH